MEKGCDDHITNLSSAEFEKRLVNLTKSWGMNFLISRGGKHAATYVVIYIMKLLTGVGHRRSFRSFLDQNAAKNFLLSGSAR